MSRAIPAKTWSRRQFLRTCGAVTLGFVAYQRTFDHGVNLLARAAVASQGYGPLIPDSAGVIDLPEGFTARIVARAGEEMADGLVVPGLPDAMGAFAGPDGTTIVVCNHETLWAKDGPFGPDNARLATVSPAKLYDLGAGMTPCPGGTTTIVWDTRSHTLVRQYQSLAGTLRNCAGGCTPWGSWISCEEIVLTAGYHDEEKVHLQKDHGYCFEVPAGAAGLVDPVPLRAMGRFMHEAVAVDPRTGIVYLTEDREDGLIYRFLPGERGNLRAGGRLQAMGLRSGLSDTSNWPGVTETMPIGSRNPVRWIDLDDIEAPDDDLRHRGHAAGACRFARGEGAWAGDGELFFVCTSGGQRQVGQIFRYVPSISEGTGAEDSTPGRLELFIEPNAPDSLVNPDNITVSPWGDIIACEDTGGNDARLIGVTRDGDLYPFAHSRRHGEFAGAVFSPDGSTLFVNLQQEGLTLAIDGPWKRPRGHHSAGRAE
ncbi:MAG TPA: alkaline phosphatase PhoX [Candidatus Krumholzibacteria bacterium]|nr:alkaline phosphatase PhoX [Candidatus Krumholzibacteria bacterium]